MPHAEYLVEVVDGRWMVRVGEKAFPYSSQEAAIAAAMGAAHKAEAQGFEAHVTIRDPEGSKEAAA